MGSSGAFAAGVTLRAALIGALTFAAAALAVWPHYYATAAIVIGAAVLIGLDLARSASVADRTEFGVSGAARSPVRQLGGARERIPERR